MGIFVFQFISLGYYVFNNMALNSIKIIYTFIDFVLYVVIFWLTKFNVFCFLTVVIWQMELLVQISWDEVVWVLLMPPSQRTSKDMNL
jgi:hypothetical protein